LPLVSFPKFINRINLVAMMILTRDKPRRGELVEKISVLSYQLDFLRWNWRTGFGLAIDFRRARFGFPLTKKLLQ
jgi:hypothetical protein